LTLGTDDSSYLEQTTIGDGHAGAEEALMLLPGLQQAFLLLKLRRKNHRGRLGQCFAMGGY